MYVCIYLWLGSLYVYSPHVKNSFCTTGVYSISKYNVMCNMFPLKTYKFSKQNNCFATIYRKKHSVGLYIIVHCYCIIVHYYNLNSSIFIYIVKRTGFKNKNVVPTMTTTLNMKQLQLMTT